MKLSKIFILASAVLAFAACSEDETWNSVKDATVGMQQAEMTISEAKGLFSVPIVVNGERNAPVQVTVEVTPVEATDETESAEEDKNYMVTGKVINIAAEDNTGKVEIKTVDDAEINLNRQFRVTIVSVKGATVDADHNSTIVTLKDNDSNFYDKLSGKWTMQVVSDSNGELSWEVTVLTYEEGGSAYENYAIITGVGGYDFMTACLTYYFDKQAKTGHVGIYMPWICVDRVDFGNFIGDIYNYGLDENGQIINSECEIVGEWNEDMSEITFASAPKFGMRILVDGAHAGWFDKCMIVKMVRQ